MQSCANVSNADVFVFANKMAEMGMARVFGAAVSVGRQLGGCISGEACNIKWTDSVFQKDKHVAVP